MADLGESRPVPGEATRAVLEFIGRSLVEHPDQLTVATDARGSTVRFAIHAAADDHGRLIGRYGRLAQAIRTVAQVSAQREGIHARTQIGE